MKFIFLKHEDQAKLPKELTYKCLIDIWSIFTYFFQSLKTCKKENIYKWKIHELKSFKILISAAVTVSSIMDFLACYC